MEDYRVQLDVYNGPLDLLLYLIQREEVDIYDIPVARITEQYLKYVELIQAVDPNLAGDFLVLASTLLEVKTRMLLPSPPPEEGAPAVLAFDPREELVRKLLEYKAIKDAARDLEHAGDLRARQFARPPLRLPGETDAVVDLEDAQVWDLFDAFSRLMEAIGQRVTHHEVVYDDTPVELHAEDILDRLRTEGPLTFRRIFEGRTRRSEIVGLFLAMLELVRRKLIRAIQEGNFGEILVSLAPKDDQSSPAASVEAREPDVSQPASDIAAGAPPGASPSESEQGEDELDEEFSLPDEVQVDLSEAPQAPVGGEPAAPQGDEHVGGDETERDGN